MPVVCEGIRYIAQELALSHSFAQRHFKASTGWCVYMMWENRFCLCSTALCQTVLTGIKEQLVDTHECMIGL